MLTVKIIDYVDIHGPRKVTSLAETHVLGDLNCLCLKEKVNETFYSNCKCPYKNEKTMNYLSHLKVS